MKCYPVGVVYQYFLGKIHPNKYQEVCNRFIEKLEWYFNEIPELNDEQQRVIKLQIIDLILQECSMARTFNNRSQCYSLIFVYYEAALNSLEFDTWLDKRIECNKDVTQEVFDHIVEDLRVLFCEAVIAGNNHGYGYGMEQFLDITSRLHGYAQECTNGWRKS